MRTTHIQYLCLFIGLFCLCNLSNGYDISTKFRILCVKFELVSLPGTVAQLEKAAALSVVELTKALSDSLDFYLTSKDEFKARLTNKDDFEYFWEIYQKLISKRQKTIFVFGAAGGMIGALWFNNLAGGILGGLFGTVVGDQIFQFKNRSPINSLYYATEIDLRPLFLKPQAIESLRDELANIWKEHDKAVLTDL